MEVSEALHRSSPQNLHCLKKRPLKKSLFSDLALPNSYRESASSPFLVRLYGLPSSRAARRTGRRGLGDGAASGGRTERGAYGQRARSRRLHPTLRQRATRLLRFRLRRLPHVLGRGGIELSARAAGVGGDAARAGLHTAIPRLPLRQRRPTVPSQRRPALLRAHRRAHMRRSSWQRKRARAPERGGCERVHAHTHFFWGAAPLAARPLPPLARTHLPAAKRCE